MRTRFRKPVSHATLLNHFEWASARNHGREMRKARKENETLKLTLRLKQAIGILLLLLVPCLLFAQVNGVVVTVPEGINVIVVRESTNKVVAPMPPSPLSVQMRMAAQLARGKAASWTQRFIAIKVDEAALTRAEDDDAPPVFSTNYTVTVVPMPSDTNSPVAWGAVKSKALKFVTTRPTKKGDEFELFPVQ